MKKQNFLLLLTICSILAAMIISSCAQAPSRKKMPGYLNAENFEAGYPFQLKEGRQSEFAFATQDEQVLFDGKMQKFVTVPLPTAEFDQTAINLIEQYKSFAGPIITEWVKQGGNGVVIDLRNPAQGGSSVTYLLEKAGEFSLPVIFRWDANSAGRVGAFTALLQQAPGINSKRTNP